MIYDAWLYSKSHVITSATTLTAYQIKLTVYYGSGTDSGSNVYCNNHCNADFSDIRFKNSSDEALPYWIESYTEGVSAVVWINVDSISTSTTIYIVYGNADATSESSGEDTFIFFDDFSGDLSKWTQNSGTWSIVNGILQTTSTGSAGTISPTTTVTLNKSEYVTATIKVSSDSNYGVLLQLPTVCQLFFNSNQISWYASTEVKATISLIANTNYKVEIYRTTSSVKIYVNDSLYINTDLTGSTGAFNISHQMPNGSVVYIDNVIVRNYNTPEPTQSTWSEEEYNIDVYTITEIISIEDPNSISLNTSIHNESLSISDIASRLVHTRVAHEIITVSDSVVNPLVYLAWEVIELLDSTIRGYLVTELIKVFNGNDMDRAGCDEYGVSNGSRLDEYGNYVYGVIKAAGQAIVRAVHFKTNTECQVIEDVAICEEKLHVTAEASEST